MERPSSQDGRIQPFRRLIPIIRCLVAQSVEIRKADSDA